MTGCQRIRAVLEGRAPDRVPVMLHNLLMAVDEAGLTHRRFREDPREIARAFIESVERYGHDGVVVDVDTATLAGAVGVPVDLPEDETARCRGPLLADLAEVESLKPVDLAASWRVRNWLEAARRVKEHLSEAVFVRGNCDQAPFSLASMIRGPAAWMLDLADPAREPGVRRLLDYCTEAACQFVELMAATGVDMVSSGDSPAGPEMISPAMYRRFALPYERRVAERARRCGRPWLVHVCGNTNLILDDLPQCGADAVELDHKTDAGRAERACRGRVVFCGNLDPVGVLQRGSPELVRRKTRELLDLFADNPRLILNAGCAIPAGTPPANLRALVAAARGE
ncbi:MAG: uroporphyrinogen decarboxylase family protein [Pirellulales bacterium]|nr:uroporphyrinogen decarboxylase family protein [Pirellulales bacterium]